MKIIFDIGCNEGQNLKYFLQKADVVVGIEANPYLIDQIKVEFKKEIDSKKLYLENVALSNEKNSAFFFINKKKNYLSQLEKPKNINDYRKIRIKIKRSSEIIKKYLKRLNLYKIELIKIDVESSSEKVLEDILNNKILSKFLSVEAQTPKILELILKSHYKSFKFIEGKDIGKKLSDLKIINKFNKKTVHNFQVHSSGPYGIDIPGRYYSKDSLVNYFINNGFGWKDINCYSNKSVKYDKIEYNKDIHKQGFRYHLKQLILEFYNSLKNKIKSYA